MLLQAFRMRRSPILGGVDEAAKLCGRRSRARRARGRPPRARDVAARGRAPRLYGKFVVIDLKPLTEEQRRAVIEHQLGGDEFFEQAFIVAAIRRDSTISIGGGSAAHGARESSRLPCPSHKLPDGGKDASGYHAGASEA